MSRYAFDVNLLEKMLNKISVINLKDKFTAEFTAPLYLDPSNKREVFREFLKNEISNLEEKQYKKYIAYKGNEGCPEVYFLNKEHIIYLGQNEQRIMNKNFDQLYVYKNNMNVEIKLENVSFRLYEKNSVTEIKLNQYTSVAFNDSDDKKFKINMKGSKSITSMQKIEDGFICEFKDSLYKSIKINPEGKVVGINFTAKSKKDLHLSDFKKEINSYEELMNEINDNIQLSFLVSDKVKIKTTKKNFKDNMSQMDFYFKNNEKIFKLLTETSLKIKNINIKPDYLINATELCNSKMIEKIEPLKDKLSCNPLRILFEKNRTDDNYFYRNLSFVLFSLMLAKIDSQNIDPIKSNEINKITLLDSFIKEEIKIYSEKSKKQSKKMKI